MLRALEGLRTAIQVSQEIERRVEDEIASGRFRSADDFIQAGSLSWRSVPPSGEAERSRAVAAILEFARNRAVPLEGITVRELIDEGRR